jgi:glycosyltransferase involved in cell wall biosynthesis
MQTIGSGALLNSRALSCEINTAIIHERLNVLAGSEKVVLAMHDLFPDAPIYTAIANDDLVSRYLPDTEIKTSFLQKFPIIAKHHQKFLPLYMLAFEQFDLSEYDLIISSSHCAAKSVITKPNACHICYCYSPMRYAWDLQHDYARHQGRLVRALWSGVANYVRMWDLSTAYRVDYFIAISKYIARRIRKFYGKESVVICPPVDVDKFHVASSVDDYYLVASRFTPYKRVDLVVEAFNQLGWRLVVVGGGEQEKYLKSIAGPNIEIKDHVLDAELVDLFAHCKGFVHAAEEDFGINMVEAQASGRPVVAYGVGGSRDIVNPDMSGVFFQKPTVGHLVDALRECEAREWDPQAIRRSSLRFSTERFNREFALFVDWAMDDFDRQDKTDPQEFEAALRDEALEAA